MKPNTIDYGSCSFTTPSGERYKSLDILIKQNHLLIAGATGSGKSTLVNDLIWQLLYSADISLVLIDPKRVELVRYKDLPQTMRHATERDDIEYTLEQVCAIMDSRYDDMAKRGLRVYDGRAIYVIIDEYADICDNKKIVASVIRLAQLGRASKIHVWVATQRPTRDVINGRIKVNLDCKVALRCSSAQDSRNIVGIPDAKDIKQFGSNGLKEAIVVAPDFIDPFMIDVLFIDDTKLDERVQFWLNQLPDSMKPRQGFFKRLFTRKARHNA